MKKYLLSVALLVAVCISAKAQFSVGIKGGVNFSNINTDNFNSSTRTGYQAGVFARFGNAFYLQPEVYLSNTGGKFVETDFPRKKFLLKNRFFCNIYKKVHKKKYVHWKKT